MSHDADARSKGRGDTPHFCPMRTLRELTRPPVCILAFMVHKAHIGLQLSGYY